MFKIIKCNTDGGIYIKIGEQKETKKPIQEIIADASLTCQECGFVAKSAFGLQVHSKKHKK
jgi:hypothetical protein